MPLKNTVGNFADFSRIASRRVVSQPLRKESSLNYRNFCKLFEAVITFPAHYDPYSTCLSRYFHE